MSPPYEKRLLQIAVALACLVPLSMGAASVILGVSILAGAPEPPPPDLDSHFRYLSGIFLVVGCAFASCVSRIETKTARFRLLGAMVVAGGLARALSWLSIGEPSIGHKIGLGIELVVVPLLLLWQARVARRFGGQGQTTLRPDQPQLFTSVSISSAPGVATGPNERAP